MIHECRNAWSIATLPRSCSGSARPKLAVKVGGRGHRDLAEMSVDDFFESGLVSSSDDESPAAPATTHQKHSKVKKR
jgi:hypothetical protein